MSITIHSLKQETAGGTLAQLTHAGNRFTALLAGEGSTLARVVGGTWSVELAIEDVIAAQLLHNFDDAQSGIAGGKTKGTHVIRGRVHSVMPVGDGTSIVDLYLRAGPEFLAITSAELPGVQPRGGDGLEVVVSGLCFYLTNT